MQTNSPTVWKKTLPKPNANSHKYTRGHSLIIGGAAATTGATRLAAISALRTGSGLVSVACDKTSLPIYAAALTSVMTKLVTTNRELDTLLEDARINAVLVGPGCGVTQKTHDETLHILSHKKACVIDADAISAFAPNPKALFNAIQSPVVLTPHEGEFARLFAVKGNREMRAAAAAKESEAILVLKGAQTVIASPDGKLMVNQNAPAWLATAGSGDVLAGMITGLLAQGMPAFEAACAGVWIHGRAAELFGAGLISEDLPDLIPNVLKELYA
jgi:hydroxyethylthiazole kinase-like uncharacterized protein yjeF